MDSIRCSSWWDGQRDVEIRSAMRGKNKESRLQDLHAAYLLLTDPKDSLDVCALYSGLLCPSSDTFTLSRKQVFRDTRLQALSIGLLQSQATQGQMGRALAPKKIRIGWKSAEENGRSHTTLLGALLWTCWATYVKEPCDMLCHLV